LKNNPANKGEAMNKNLPQLDSRDQLESQGYAIVTDVLDAASCKSLADAVALANWGDIRRLLIPIMKTRV
jgi:hypothetical protein